MPLPVKQRTWIIDPNNRILFTSLVQTMREYLFQIKEFLKLNGYTVRGSSDGTTGAMDLADRWVTAANAGTRATVAGAPQSWIVLRDGSGVDILLTYQGASDDIARFSFSASQLFVAAGTPTHQPTATDERVITSAVTVIGSTASGDRLWNGWVDSTFKLCRFAVIRAQTLVGLVWGVEEVDSAVTGGSTWTPPVWGFSLSATTNHMPNGSTAGIAKPIVASVAQSPAVQLGAENIGGSSTIYTHISGGKPDLQGGIGFPLFPLVIGSNTAGSAGKLGNLYDWWIGRTAGEFVGDIYGDLEFIHICTVQGTATATAGVWPWDGVTEPQLV